jgi:glycosyltransferase involved in cell wall biosynthesis
MASARPLIVYVWLYREWGGAQTYLLGLIARVRERFDVLVLLPEGSSPTLLGYLDRAAIPYLCFRPAAPAVAAVGMRAKLTARWRKLRSEIACARLIAALPDARLLHCDLGPWLSFRFFVWALRRHAVVITLHTRFVPPGDLRTWSWRRRMMRIDRTPGFRAIAANADVRASLSALLPPDRVARVPVAYSFVDLDEIGCARARRPTRQTLEAQLGVPADRTLLIVLGQCIERKGRRTLLEALHTLDAQAYACVWISTTPADEATTALIREFGVGDRFRVVTQRDLGEDRLDLLAALAAADMFVMPSYQEGLPLALVEAMALGVPVVASRINAVPEAVEHGVDGWLVPPGDAGALATAIDGLRRDAALRARLAEAGRRKAERLFDVRITARETMQVYDALLAEGR